MQCVALLVLILYELLLYAMSSHIGVNTILIVCCMHCLAILLLIVYELFFCMHCVAILVLILYELFAVCTV